MGSITRYVSKDEVTHRIVRLEADTVVFQNIQTNEEVTAARANVCCLRGSDRDVGKGYMLHDDRWHRECPH